MNCELPLILTTINILVVYVTHNLLYCSKFKLAFWGRSSNSQLLKQRAMNFTWESCFQNFPYNLSYFHYFPTLSLLILPFFPELYKKCAGLSGFSSHFPRRKSTKPKGYSCSGFFRATYIMLSSSAIAKRFS